MYAGSFKDYISHDYAVNVRYERKRRLMEKVLCEHGDAIWRYLVFLRKEEYYWRKNHPILSVYYRRRKNKLGERLGFTIPRNVFGEGLRIWHCGNIVVNGQAKVGKNCILHGDNCIGNNGKDEGAPTIGDHVDIGVGAKIIGNIKIANGIVIGAGAVVNKSFLEPDIIIAGVPAGKIKNREI
jgi:serine O-acetyltransferase